MGDAAEGKSMTRTQKKNRKKQQKKSDIKKAASGEADESTGAAAQPTAPIMALESQETIFGLLLPEIVKILKEKGEREELSKEDGQELRETILALPQTMARTLTKMRMCTSAPPPPPSATQHNIRAATMIAATKTSRGARPTTGQHEAKDARPRSGQHDAKQARGAMSPNIIDCNGRDEKEVFAELWKEAEDKAHQELALCEEIKHDDIHESAVKWFRILKKKYKNKQRRLAKMKQYVYDAHDRGDKLKRGHLQQQMVAK